MATSRPLDLEITIISAKHLKNVNWKNGELKPYAVFWVHPDRRLATKSDDSGSTKPVWNERFSLPLTLSLNDSYLTLEIFHSKPSETPKPLVGTLRASLKNLSDPDDYSRIRIYDLIRPSGRPQGTMKIKLCIRERPLPLVPPPDSYHIAPPQSYFYGSAPPPPSRDYRYCSVPPSPPPPPPCGSYHDAYNSSPPPYYSGYYSSAPPPMPPRPFFERAGGYGGPSAPVDYTPYDQRQKGGKMGFGSGVAVGAVAGALGGLALEEGLKYEEDKIADKVGSDIAGRDDYRADY